MNTLNANQFESYQDRLGRSIAARLSETTNSLPNDISERLKAARMQALGKRKIVKLQTARSVSDSGGAATMTADDGDNSLWSRFGAIIPLLALVVGLLSIGVFEEQLRVKEVADVDVELLADELPPSAYTDPGFAHYLRTNRHE